MTIALPKKRGRPSNAELAARKVLLEKPKRSDAEVLADLTLRFDMLARLAKAALERNTRALVVSGAPGIGKTYTVEQVLENTKGAKYIIVRGTLSAVNLYKIGYEYRNPGNVIVLDDADSIFNDEEALNILKALCDSSDTRRVSWLKESNALREEDVPPMFDYHGAMIFISNWPFQDMVDRGGAGKHLVHIEALLSRSLYLDLMLHERQALALWVRHVATAGKMFRREGVSEAVGKDILEFIDAHRERLRGLCLRTLMKACQLAKANPRNWRDDAKILLCRPS